MRHRLSTLASPVLSVLCFAMIFLSGVSFVKPLGISRDWVDQYRDAGVDFNKIWAGQGGRSILMSHGVLYDHSFAFGHANVDRSRVVRHEQEWSPGAAGDVSETTLGFSWSEGAVVSSGYSYERQRSVPLLFIALVTGPIPLMNFLARRRRIGRGFPVQIPPVPQGE